MHPIGQICIWHQIYALAHDYKYANIPSLKIVTTIYKDKWFLTSTTGPYILKFLLKLLFKFSFKSKS